MIKHSHTLCHLIALSALLTGCHLDAAPDCILGQKRCENDAVLNLGIIYTCMDNNTWQGMTCPSVCTDTKSCTENETVISCSNNGEKRCESVHSLNIHFSCIDHKWLPEICDTGSTCQDNTCTEIQTKCEEGSQWCTQIESMHTALAAICNNGKWITTYCDSNLGCDGNVCATPHTADDIHSCGGTKIDCEQTITGWN